MLPVVENVTTLHRFQWATKTLETMDCVQLKHHDKYSTDSAELVRDFFCNPDRNEPR